MNDSNTLRHRLAWVMWPAFLVACIAEFVVFSVVDPNDLHVLGRPVDLARETVYAIGFFMFWGFGILSSSLSVFLSRSPWEVNRCPYAFDERPAACGTRERARPSGVLDGDPT